MTWLEISLTVDGEMAEAVAEVFNTSLELGDLEDYSRIRRKLYRVRTNFFDINKGRVDKRGFYRELYDRIVRLVGMAPAAS